MRCQLWEGHPPEVPGHPGEHWTAPQSHSPDWIHWHKLVASMAWNGSFAGSLRRL
jgi:hypothetical protein